MNWRNVGLTVNTYLEKWMSIWVISAMVIGFLGHNWVGYGKNAVIVLFGFMTLVTALGTQFKDITYVIRHPWNAIVAILLLHAVLPGVAFVVGRMFLAHHEQYLIGIVLAAAIPVGVTSVMWTDIAKGNVALALSVVSIDTLLSPILLPLSIHLIIGKTVHLPLAQLFWGLVWMIVLPTAFGITLNSSTKGRIKPLIQPFAGPLSKLSMLAVVAINVAVVTPSLSSNRGLPTLLSLLVVLAALGYSVGNLSGYFVTRDHRTRVSLTYNVGMRNLSAGITIASQYFSHTATIPVVLSMLFQQPLATAVYWLYQKRSDQSHPAHAIESSTHVK